MQSLFCLFGAEKRYRVLRHDIQMLKGSARNTIRLDTIPFFLEIFLVIMA